jgi:site-specific recombinase XerD
MAGVDLRTIQDLGGWKTLALVQRYSHLSASHRAEAVERIAGKFPNAIHNTDSCDEKPAAISN